MRILTRKQFLAIDHEVLFSKYAPCYFEELQIKLDNVGPSDFSVQEINDAIESSSSTELMDKLDEAATTGAPLTMDFYGGYRDGLFDVDQLFAVWDKEDVQKLIDRLTEALRTYPN